METEREQTRREETLTTGELAERAGVNLQTVRYYERRGLLPEPPRTAAGYRQFDGKDVARIRFTQRAQKLGSSLREIEELLSLRADPETSKGEVRRRATAKIEEVKGKIRDLERIERTLEELVAACSGEGSTSDCPILHALDPPPPEQN